MVRDRICISVRMSWYLNLSMSVFESSPLSQSRNYKQVPIGPSWVPTSDLSPTLYLFQEFWTSKSIQMSDLLHTFLSPPLSRPHPFNHPSYHKSMTSDFFTTLSNCSSVGRSPGFHFTSGTFPSLKPWYFCLGVGPNLIASFLYPRLMSDLQKVSRPIFTSTSQCVWTRVQSRDDE